MNRRLALATTATAALAACSTLTASNTQAVAARIVVVSQASLTTLRNVLAVYGITPTGQAATALDAAQAATTALSEAAPSGADAVAKLATDPVNGSMALISAAAPAVVATLRTIPGTQNAVNQVQLAVIALGMVATLAASLRAPSVAPGAAPGPALAARRLGVG